MRIVLINCPNTYELVGNDPVIIKEQQGIYPPLGILYIAAHLETLGYEMHVIDAQADILTHEQVANRVLEIKPDLVGLTAMTFTLVDCKLVMQAIRRKLSVPIIVGGPHTAIYPEECFEPTGLNADYVVVGEGEITLDTLAKDIESGKVNTSMPIHNRIYRQAQFIDDLNLLPFPARHLIPTEKYYSVLAKSTPTTTSFSSRGCPFSCSYCDRPALGKGFRAMNAQRVVDEMQECEKMGIKEIFYYDDTFSVSMKRVDEICDEILKRGVKIRWDIRTRVNVVNDKLLEKMARAGCDRIHFGVESGNPRIVRVMNKGTSIKQVEDAFAMCKKYKIKTLAYFMLGNPTETFDDVKDTLAIARKIKPDFMQMTILSPFPATKYYLDYLRIPGHTDVWKQYAREINDDFRPPLWDEIYTREELESQMRWFYRKFYLTPRFVWERIKEVRNLGQFKRYASAGWSLVKMTLLPEKKLKDSWGLRTRTGVASSAKPESAVAIN